MSKLHNLVSDLHTLFLDCQPPKEADMQKFLKDISDSIYQSFEPRKSSKNSIRFSNVGRPARQLWYASKMPEMAEELHLPTRIKFLYGHLIEHLLLLLIKSAGYKVTNEQSKKEVDGIVGHMDAKINGVVVDIKTASQHGYDKFVKGTIFEDDPFGYIAQISGYADEDEEAAFIVLNKVTGQVHVADIHSMERINFKERVKDVKKVLKSDTPPDRCYADIPDGKSGNRKLAAGCAYCDFKVECWKDANDGVGLRKFKYANGSRFFTHVAKRPHPDIEEEEVTYVSQ